MVWKTLPDAPKPPRRKNFDDKGTVGRPIRLRSNHFPVTLDNPKVLLFHYDVEIRDDNGDEIRLSKDKQMGIFRAMVKQNNGIFTVKTMIGFDKEKSAYSIGEIPQFRTRTTLPAQYAEDEGAKESKYKVSLVIVNKISIKELFNYLRPQSAEDVFPGTLVQMLDVIFNYYRSVQHCHIGRNTVFLRNREGDFTHPYNIGGGKECVLGFFSSLRPARWKDGGRLLLNLDVAHAAFLKPQPVLDFIKERFPDVDFRSELGRGVQKDINKELRHVKIVVQHTHIKRSYKFQKFAPKGPRQQKFPLQDENTGRTKDVSVESYFRDKYNAPCHYPMLNCAHVGNPNKNTFIPLEYCHIAKNQKSRTQLGDKETANFVRNTAKPPRDRLRQIEDIRRTVKQSDEKIIKQLGFRIDDKPLNFSGRVLDHPNISLSNGQRTVRPKDGVWDIRNNQFQAAGKIQQQWAVVNFNFRTDEGKINRFVNNLVTMGQDRGMDIDYPAYVQARTQRYSEPLNEFKLVQNKIPKVQLILCITTKNIPDLYGKIKTAGDTELGIITQCVQAFNVEKCQQATISNILLKINSKIGGVNNIVSDQNMSQLQLFNAPIMVMGADVNHPPAGDTSTPSLVAVVGSYDKNATRFNVEIRHQKHRVEEIKDMKEITMSLLKGFYKITSRKPQRIIMYRDGVSESQFSTVLSYELRKMREACTALEKDYQPAITFVCVQKRHHTRLFCEDPRDGVGRSGNVPAGTTVDTDITHMTERDFYLCSHQGILGTSRPTHYHVLWDDSDLEMNQLQMLTYFMCHTYSRCTRSVSIPTPAYYSHLAAYRAKIHLATKFGDDVRSQSSGGSINDIPDDELKRAISINREKLSSPLYFV